jgi:heat shock protein HslJ
MVRSKLLVPAVVILPIMLLLINCSSSTYKYDSDIRNKYWKLVELYGDTVVIAEDQREMHIIFKLNEEKVTGSGGCNNFSGSYKLNGDSVKIGPLLMTRKFCDSLMDQEVKFMKALEEAADYKVYNEFLKMMVNERVIAKFRSIYF